MDKDWIDTQKTRENLIASVIMISSLACTWINPHLKLMCLTISGKTGKYMVNKKCALMRKEHFNSNNPSLLMEGNVHNYTVW